MLMEKHNIRSKGGAQQGFNTLEELESALTKFQFLEPCPVPLNGQL